MFERRLATLTFAVVGLCFAIWGAIRMAETSYWFFAVRGGGPEATVVLAALLPGLLGCVAGVCIWRGAETLASTTVATQEIDAKPRVPGSEALLAIAFSGVGTFLLVQGLAGLAKGGILLYLNRQGAPTAMDFADAERFRARMWDGFAKADMVAAGVRVLLATGLLLGPAWLAAGFVRLRKELRGSLVVGHGQGPEGPEGQSGA